jgi:site-specific DNA-methyltransferase (adenine-specific)
VARLSSSVSNGLAPTIWIPEPVRSEKIGNATVYLGDCRDVLESLEPVSHILTDPPYEKEAHRAMGRTHKAIKEGTVAHLGFSAITDEMRTFAAEQAKRLVSGWAIYFCQAEAVGKWQTSIEDSGAKYRGPAVWVKPDSSPQFTGDKPAVNFEMIVLAWCGGGRSRWNAGGKRGTYRHNVNGRGRDGRHPTEKPVPLMRELLADFTNSGEIILDPFMGSGSVGVACLATDRTYVGIERDLEFFQIACERLEAANGKGSLCHAANDNTQPASPLFGDFTEGSKPAFLMKTV